MNEVKTLAQLIHPALRTAGRDILEDRHICREVIARSSCGHGILYSADLENADLMRDFNSAGVVAAHLGLPLSQMLDQRRYTVYEEVIQVSEEPRKLCHEVIEKLVEKL